MSVYARNHAWQLVIDRATPGTKSSLSPRAQLLLLHIAGQPYVGNEFDSRKPKTGAVWDADGKSRYFEGLGLKARAIGYNVPESISSWTEDNEGITAKQLNTVKWAVNKSIKELIDFPLGIGRDGNSTGFLRQITDNNGRIIPARPGQTAEYELPFLNFACSTCGTKGKDGKWYMDHWLHVPQKQREEARDNFGVDE
ncbi:hypothetical protein ACTXJU_17805 [Glutamicibacter ardleyensis]|uniref:hypothetical protein n=1 Tax=Glutamicibacter ardleyensis TaxID=225894 RepID=UPI003FD34BFF